MSARIACEPLLGQTTIVHGDTVLITVIVVSDRPGKQWEAAIWHSISGSEEWIQSDLERVEDEAQVLQEDLCKPGMTTVFTGLVQQSPATDNIMRFTVKYRIHGQAWQWATKEAGTGDAEIIFSQHSNIPQSMSNFLHSMNSSIKCEASAFDKANQGGPHVWAISIPVPPATETSTFSCANIGIPVDMVQWFCLARESRPWLCPRQGRGRFSPVEDSILVSLLFRNGLHLVLLALSFNDVLTVIKPGSDNSLTLVARNERAAGSTAYVLAAAGKTFEDANQAVMNHAKELVAQEADDIGNKAQDLQRDIPLDSLNDWYDSFAYCTWNGLGQNFTDETLYRALESMFKAGIDFSTLIIDDNWQSIDEHGANNFHHRWTRFEADKTKFPRGLKNTISTIRERYPLIKQIAVWHGIMGYWNGFSPEGALITTYKTKKLKKQDNGFFGGGTLLAVDADQAERLYDDFYGFLADCGVNSVKTDTQFLLDQLENAPDRRRFISAYQDAWLKASAHHFSAKAISCMSQVPQNIFHSQLLISQPKLMVRNSEDFFPDEPSSHPWHIFCNAHTNVFTQHLNVLPDWDMFQTSHEYSYYHAAARCISGGPIYFTDEPGKHDLALIKQMTARNDDGLIILRPRVAKTTYVYANKEEKRLLRIGTSTIDTGVPLLGIFNTNNESLLEIVKLEHFPSLPPAEEYIIRAHASRDVSEPMSLQNSSIRPLLLSLDRKQCEILTAYPLHVSRHHEKHTTLHVAVLGLLDKMTGAAAVLRSTVHGGDEGLAVRVTLKAIGLLGIYISSTIGDVDISRVRICDEPVPADAMRYVVDEKIFEVDMETTWELRDKPHMGKEISFEMLVQ
ncbi:galactinol-sucrose galactosyltransferase 6 [Phlyctema vagabunda]|uniref:Galactinol-sucrose galactosyltransferase 6 n=1 Tax=Phlyctema vagabunda TaxID=108571 RepID=A0ABR4P8H3_9HELO